MRKYFSLIFLLTTGTIALAQNYSVDSVQLAMSRLEKAAYLIISLSVISLLFAVVAFCMAFKFRKEKSLKEVAENESNAKQDLIEFISKDLRNPMNSERKGLQTFIENAKQMSDEQIVAESQKLLEEEEHLRKNVAEYVSDLVIQKKKVISNFGLSTREMEIMHLSMEGLSAVSIAEKLNISVRTVSNHKANIYSKMGVRSNAEMCKKAAEFGL